MSYILESLSDNEEVQDLFKPHWFIWLPSLCCVLVGLVAAGLLGYFLNGAVAIIAFGVFTLFGIAQGLSIVSLEQGVTNKRIIRKTGIVGRQSEEMKLSSVETVEIDQGVLGRVFNYGTVRVTGKGISSVIFYKIDNPMAVKKAIESVSNPLQ